MFSKVEAEAEEVEEEEEEELPPRRPPRFDHDPLLHYPGYLYCTETPFEFLP